MYRTCESTACAFRLIYENKTHFSLFYVKFYCLIKLHEKCIKQAEKSVCNYFESKQKKKYESTQNQKMAKKTLIYSLILIEHQQ